jgi:hypothetical protein
MSTSARPSSSQALSITSTCSSTSAPLSGTSAGTLAYPSAGTPLRKPALQAPRGTLKRDLVLKSGWGGLGAPAALKSTHGGRARHRPQAVPQTPSSDLERGAPQPAHTPGGAPVRDCGRPGPGWTHACHRDAQAARPAPFVPGVRGRGQGAFPPARGPTATMAPRRDGAQARPRRSVHAAAPGQRRRLATRAHRREDQKDVEHALADASPAEARGGWRTSAGSSRPGAAWIGCRESGP